VTVSHTDPNAVAGDPTTFNITVINNSSNDVTGARVTNRAIAGHSFIANGEFRFQSTWNAAVSYTASGTAGTAGYTAGGTGDINDVVDIPAHGQITYTAVVIVDSSAIGGSFGDQAGDLAAVIPPANFVDMIPYDNSTHDIIPIIRRSDVGVTISDSAGGSSAAGAIGTATAGETIVYTVVVTNNGPSDVSNLFVRAALPGLVGDTFQFIDYRGAPPSAQKPGINLASGDTYGSLPAGKSDTFIITAKIDSSFLDLPMSQIVATFTAYGSIEGTEPNPDNNTATITDDIVPAM